MTGFSVKKGVIVNYNVGSTFKRKDGTETAFVNLTIELSLGEKYKVKKTKRASIEECIFDEVFQSLSKDKLIKSEVLAIYFDGVEYKLPNKPANMSEDAYQSAIDNKFVRKTSQYRECNDLGVLEIVKLGDGENTIDGQYRYIKAKYESIETFFKFIKKAL